MGLIRRDCVSEYIVFSVSLLQSLLIERRVSIRRAWLQLKETIGWGE